MRANNKTVRITNLIHAKLKDVAIKEGITITSLVESYIEQGLKGFADTIRYFQEKYGNKDKKEDIF